jgi:predicted phage terminase large subunit-like protein
MSSTISPEILQSLSTNQLKSLKKALEKDLAEGSLSQFVKKTWPVLEPGTQYLPNWHIDLICEYLEAVTRGDVRRLIINVPPRYGKSLLTSVMWPCWVWTTRPESRWIFASYSLPLSYKLSVDRRTLLLSDWYQSYWGDQFELREDLNLKSEFGNNRRGMMVAASVNGSLTGKGGNYLVVDDPLNPLEALSEVERERANIWFRETFSSRLDDKHRGAIVIIMQRLHEKDLTGTLLESDNEWVHLKLPAISEEHEEIRFPISGKVVHRSPGEVLWPLRENAEEIDKQRRIMGSYAFQGQYMQQPIPAGGTIFKKEWLKYFEKPLERFDLIISSWDCSFSSSSSYVVGQIWGRSGVNNYLLDQARGKWDFPDTLAAIRGLNRKWPKINATIIEAKANGPALISILSNEIAGVIPTNPHESKEARAIAVSPLFESGKVQIPDIQQTAWVSDYIRELQSFPGGSHDDQVDCTSQALLYLEERWKSTRSVRCVAHFVRLI